MSLCDRCFAPGHCCKRLTLNQPKDRDNPDGEWEPLTTWEGGALEQMARMGLPFVPLEKRAEWQDEAGRTYVQWTWACPRLLPNGRCGDYENRPRLCRSYQPLDDGLCVHFGGAEAGDPSVPPEMTVP